MRREAQETNEEHGHIDRDALVQRVVAQYEAARATEREAYNLWVERRRELSRIGQILGIEPVTARKDKASSWRAQECLRILQEEGGPLTLGTIHRRLYEDNKHHPSRTVGRPGATHTTLAKMGHLVFQPARGLYQLRDELPTYAALTVTGDDGRPMPSASEHLSGQFEQQQPQGDPEYDPDEYDEGGPADPAG